MLELSLTGSDRHKRTAQALLRFMPSFRVLLATSKRLVLLTDGLDDEQWFQLQDLLELA